MKLINIQNENNDLLRPRIPEFCFWRVCIRLVPYSFFYGAGYIQINVFYSCLDILLPYARLLHNCRVGREE